MQLVALQGNSDHAYVAGINKQKRKFTIGTHPVPSGGENK